MADSLEGFTYGRDYSGIEKIKQTFEERFDVIIQDLTIDSATTDGDRSRLRASRSEALTKLLDVIDNNWQGEDQISFTNLIKDKTADMVYNLEKYKEDIKQALDDCYHDFVTFQEQQSSSIGH